MPRSTSSTIPNCSRRFKALGKKCHLILANGAFKHAEPMTRTRRCARELRSDRRSARSPRHRAGTSRTTSSWSFCDSSGKPQRVLSGSTNWTMTGLCTQANNGIIVNDPELAAGFPRRVESAEGGRQRLSADAWPRPIRSPRASPSTAARITQWFAPTDDGAGPRLCAQADQRAPSRASCSCSSIPAPSSPTDKPEEKWTLLQNILFRHHQGTAELRWRPLYPRRRQPGDCRPDHRRQQQAAAKPSTHAALDPCGRGTPVTLFSGGKQPPQRLGYELMVPKNIKDAFHNWATEILGAGRSHSQQGHRDRSVRRTTRWS